MTYTITVTTSGEFHTAHIAEVAYSGPRDRCRLTAVEACAHQFMRCHLIPMKKAKRIESITRDGGGFKLTVTNE